MTAAGGTRLGLVWQSDVARIGGERQVVRIVQKGTRLKTPGGPDSLPDELALVVTVILLPARALSLLLFGQRFKLGVVSLETDGSEKIVRKEKVRGESQARERARAVFAELRHPS